MHEPRQGSDRPDQTDSTGVLLFFGGLAAMFGAFVIGVITGYWHLPLLIVLAGGGICAYIGMNRRPDIGRH